MPKLLAAPRVKGYIDKIVVVVCDRLHNDNVFMRYIIHGHGEMIDDPTHRHLQMIQIHHPEYGKPLIIEAGPCRFCRTPPQ